MSRLDDCREIVRQLWPYLDGALPDEWQVRVVAHLDACTNCTSHFDFARVFLEAIQRSGAVSLDVEPLRARVVAALEAEGMRAP